MASEFGKQLKISIFGESHGPAIGVVIDGLPAGEALNLSVLQQFLARRAPGQNRMTTARKEPDLPQILSGVLAGKTTGAPLCAVIQNTDTHASDYANLRDIPRPSHADYPAFLHYHGYQDIRGGGHFSGRLTAPLCIAGGICLQILGRRGIFVGSHLASVGPVSDWRFDAASVTPELLSSLCQKSFPVLSEEAGIKMQAEIDDARKALDSVGGTIECAVTGYPAGIGGPMFDGVENRLSAALFGIPAVRGVEFGAGFDAAAMRGSAHNDAYCCREGQIITQTNRHGGILGGISTGMPIVFRVAIKPTPSIAQEQDSVSLSRMEPVKLQIKGRHDPCIAVRALPCVEAAAAAVLLDLLLSESN